MGFALSLNKSKGDVLRQCKSKSLLVFNNFNACQLLCCNHRA